MSQMGDEAARVWRGDGEPPETAPLAERVRWLRERLLRLHRAGLGSMPASGLEWRGGYALGLARGLEAGGARGAHSLAWRAVASLCRIEMYPGLIDHHAVWYAEARDLARQADEAAMAAYAKSIEEV